jgi:acyl carrier protein
LEVFILSEHYLDFVLGRAKVVFSREDITPETRFKEELNAKSIGVAQLMNAIEDEYNVEVPFMQFKRKKTITEVADYVKELVES